MNIQQAAVAYRRSRQEYEKLFRDYFHEQVQPLPDVRFWQLQPVFADEVYRFRFGYGRTNGVQQAAGEFFRKALVRDFEDLDGRKVPAYSTCEAIQFAKSWRAVVNQLDDAVCDVVDDRGDDAYGDLLDSLPLAGQDVYKRSLERQFRDNLDLEEAVTAACLETPGLAAFVLRGENYVAMSLVDAACEHFASACISNGKRGSDSAVHPI